MSQSTVSVFSGETFLFWIESTLAISHDISSALYQYVLIVSPLYGNYMEIMVVELDYIIVRLNSFLVFWFGWIPMFDVQIPISHAGFRRPDCCAGVDAEVSPSSGFMGCKMIPLRDQWTRWVFSITLWLFDIAMENGPFTDGLPMKNGDFPWLY